MLDGLFNLAGGAIPVLLIVVVLVLVVAYMGTRYKVAGANEALIISGRREKGPEGAVGLKVVRGQGVIVLPLINKVGRLHLSARQINIQLSDAVTKQGIKVAVQGVATVKIGSDEESIRAEGQTHEISATASEDITSGTAIKVVGTAGMGLVVERLTPQPIVAGPVGPGAPASSAATTESASTKGDASDV